MNTRVVSAFAQKDIVDAIRNRYLLGALLTPVFVAILLRVLLPGISNLNFTVVVHDPGDSRLVSELRAVPHMKVITAASAEGMSNDLEKSKAVGGLAIPANFDADIAAGKQPELVVYVNNKQKDIEQAMFRQLVERQFLAIVKERLPARLSWIDVNKEAGAESPALNLNQMLLPMLLLLTFAMAGALVVPLLLVEEKEKRTLDFLLTSPASLSEIIAGKALTGVVYSVLFAGILLAVNYKLVGNWPLTLLTILFGILFVVAVGLFMGALFENTMQVNTWAGLVLFVLLAPSFPSLRLPATLEQALHFVPTYYFVEALRLALAGTPSTRFWVHMAVVLASTVVAFAAAIWALHRHQH
ncbi:MAG: type transport system permease protein [Acidobacteriota bacterium]|jgi:ABC-2 type transport system permease protein